MKSKNKCRCGRPVFKKDVLCRKHIKLRDALEANFLKIYKDFENNKPK